VSVGAQEESGLDDSHSHKSNLICRAAQYKKDIMYLNSFIKGRV